MIESKDFNSGDARIALERQKDFYMTAQPYADALQVEQGRDLRICYGDRNVWREIYKDVGLNGETLLNLNRTLVAKNQLTGFQRRNRKSSIVVPINNEDSQTTDQLTKILMWNFQANKIYNTLSDAFEIGGLITGMSLLQADIDYENDPESGDIIVRHIPWNTFMVDPFFRKKDFTDCSGVLVQGMFNKIDLANHYPEFKKEIMSMGSSIGTDMMFPNLPEQYSPSPKAKLRLSEFYYKTSRTQYMVYDPIRMRYKEWNNPIKERVKTFLEQFPEASFSKRQTATVNVTITVEDLVVYDGPQRLGIDRMPFVPVIGYYNPELSQMENRVMGIIRNARDAQYIYNSRKSIELANLQSVKNSGYIYKPSSVIDPDDINNTYPGKGIAIDKSGQVTDVIPLQQPIIPPTTLEMDQQYSEEINRGIGITDEIFGFSNDEAATTVALKQGASLTTQNVLFDNLDLAQQVLSEIILGAVQANYTPNKVKMIINEEPTQSFYDQDFPRYHISIEDGVYTSTQRQIQFLQLLQLRDRNIAIPDKTIIESMTVQNKQQLIQDMEQAQQAQMQQAQAQSQVEMQSLQAQAELAQSKSQENYASSAERMAQVQENMATADEKRAMGLLDFIKSINELEGMQLQDIEKAVKVMQVLKSMESQTQESQTQNTQSK